MSTAPQTGGPIRAYLAELEDLLRYLDPVVRARTVEAVRARILGTLAERGPGVQADPQSRAEAVEAVLTELGPPAGLARAAYDEHRAATPLSDRPVRRWVPRAALALIGLGLALGMLVVALSGSGTRAGAAADTGVGADELLAAVFDAIFAGGLFWLLGMALAASSDLVAAREKLGVSLAVPVGLILDAVLLYVLSRALGAAGSSGQDVALAVAPVVVALTGLLGAAVVLRRARRRADALERAADTSPD